MNFSVTPKPRLSEDRIKQIVRLYDGDRNSMKRIAGRMGLTVGQVSYVIYRYGKEKTKTGKCKGCHATFVKHVPNHLYCDDCGTWRRCLTTKMKKKIDKKQKEIEAELARQCIVYTSQKYSQEFLRGLVPK